ncbi:unnamed protein product [Cyprideis torosa]|uniref:Uncharacterized protein n=1 Tax=Cyprideis torosa TaxID=163714 RepID=A0A7R8WIJ6_9CRUS|nr:unnamed protein product [Cyprideis torosa]CAG0894201.1 unnamed protein product [Cyprideis torosa]
MPHLNKVRDLCIHYVTSVSLFLLYHPIKHSKETLELRDETGMLRESTLLMRGLLLICSACIVASFAYFAGTQLIHDREMATNVLENLTTRQHGPDRRFIPRSDTSVKFSFSYKTFRYIQERPTLLKWVSCGINVLRLYVIIYLTQKAVREVFIRAVILWKQQNTLMTTCTKAHEVQGHSGSICKNFIQQHHLVLFDYSAACFGVWTLRTANLSIMKPLLGAIKRHLLGQVTVPSDIYKIKPKTFYQAVNKKVFYWLRMEGVSYLTSWIFQIDATACEVFVIKISRSLLHEPYFDSQLQYIVLYKGAEYLETYLLHGTMVCFNHMLQWMLLVWSETQLSRWKTEYALENIVYYLPTEHAGSVIKRGEIDRIYVPISRRPLTQMRDEATEEEDRGSIRSRGQTSKETSKVAGKDFRVPWRDVARVRWGYM